MQRQGNGGNRLNVGLPIVGEIAVPVMDWTDLEKKFVKTITKGFSVRGVVPSLYCSAGIADFHGVVG